MSDWLLSADALDALRAAEGYQPTAEQLSAFEARGAGGVPVTRSGSTAEIAVRGVLSERPDILAALFGGGNVTYSSIRDALAQADADPAVRDIAFDVQSPGGTVEGLFETLDAIKATRKPIRSRASLAASAAYALVAAAGKIEAVGPMATFGSIGVATSIRVRPDVVDIASTHAPNKRPNVTTPEGVAAVRERLDAIHEMFADAIAQGRSTTVARVNKDFGRGGVFLARRAMEAKMIDTISPAGSTRARSSATAELGPNQQAAAALEVAFGSAGTAGAGESQAAFAERLLSGLQPPPKPKRSRAEITCDLTLGVSSEPENEPETARGRAIADAVIASMKAERDPHFPRR